MSVWRPVVAFVSRLRDLFVRHQLSQEADREIEMHLDLLTAQYVRAGASPAEARRMARAKFGGVTQIKESLRDQMGFPMLESLGHDVRFSVRSLLRERAFAMTAVATLAVGIAGAVSIFSIFDTVVLRALPFDQPDRLALLRGRLAGTATERIVPLSAAEFPDYRDRCRSCAGMAAFEIWPRTMTGVGDPQRLQVGRASATLFPLLGVRPALGRTFLPEEDSVGRDGVVVLAFGFWQRYWGAAEDVVGRSLLLDDRQFEVVGVLPRESRFPPGLPLLRQPELWVPFALNEDDVAARGRRFGTGMLVRLRGGFTRGRVSRELEAIASVFHTEHPEVYRTTRTVPVLTPLREEVLGEDRSWVVMLSVSVGLLLVTACANVAGLFIARGAGRRAELGMRVALGATSGRIVRLLFVDSLTLSTTAGVIGTLIARGIVEIIRRFGPTDVAGLDAAILNWRAVLFAASISILTSLLCGVIPAVAIGRSRLASSMKEAGPAMERGHGTLRSFVVVAETGVALVLLVGAGLLVSSFVRLVGVDPGFRVDGVTAIQTAVPDTRYPTPESRNVVSRGILAGLRRIPDGRAAAASHLPLTSDWNVVLTVEGGDRSQLNVVSTAAVSQGYFEAMGIPLLSGRDFNDSDVAGAAGGGLIISQSLARALWPGGAPLGKRAQIGAYDVDRPWDTIVGVVGDVHARGLERAPTPLVYQSLLRLDGWPAPTFAVRTTRAAASILGDMRQAIWTIDRDLPVNETYLMTDIVGEALRRRQFSLFLMAAFGVCALALTAVGLFGVVSYEVACRTQEIGVRISLGARQVDIVRGVVSKGLKIACVGAVLGLVASFPIWRLFASVLYGVGPGNLFVFAGAAALVLAVSLIATYVPARRASRVDAAKALRAE